MQVHESRGMAPDRMTVNGIELEILRRGQGTPVLLLHGMDTVHPGAPFLDLLGRHGEIIAPSSPGFGNSKRPPDFDTIYDRVKGVATSIAGVMRGAVRTSDAELRHALSDADRFDHACRVLPGPDQFFAHGALEPIGAVRPMTGLINRLRRFTDADGQPLVTGFHALGDAHTTTNPLYGRGCALAVVQARLLADAYAAHPADADARGAAYEAASAIEVEPWFEASVQMDRMGSDPGGSGAVGATGDEGADSDAAKAMAAVFAAAATHPVIGRGIARLMNLLVPPSALMADGEFLTAVAAVVADPDRYPLPERIGPTRAELLTTLTSPTGAVA